MSHATVLVALPPNEDIEAAIEAAMSPFDENDVEMFADGSRWDWWVIGGRWSGQIGGRNVARREEVNGNELVSCHSFLDAAKKEWHERRRMGWWCTTAATECERANEQHEGRCIHECGQSGARIISWNGDDKWSERFFDRFIRGLPAETLLVVVDYHV